MSLPAKDSSWESDGAVAMNAAGAALAQAP
jgi:hypothetical protein